MSKKSNLRTLGIGLSLFVSACGGLPQHAVTRTDPVSLLVFKGGPENAEIIVDGVLAGRLLEKQTQIAIADGTHSVSIQWQSHTIYSKIVFIEDGTQKIISLSDK